MARRDIGTDDARVRVRAKKRGSRPRTKRRPLHEDAERGIVTAVDRGRYQVLLEDGTEVVAMKARELGRRSVIDPITGEVPPRTIVVGDNVGVVGDTTGRKDTLARIVRIFPRSTALRRTAEDSEAQGVERVIVANADQMAIVAALADPPPRAGMIDRCLVAAFDAGLEPLLVLTKADLAGPEEVLARYEGLKFEVVVTHGIPVPDNPGVHTLNPEDLERIAKFVAGKRTVFVGHSGVGKSTLVNALIPDADRAVGHVNVVTGRGRHTSTSAVALELPGGGWLIDTPGVRTFGLAHVDADSLLAAFPDLDEAAHAPEPAGCPRGCTHLEDAPDCALDVWAAEASGRGDGAPAARLASFRRLLASKEEQEEPGGGE